MIKEFTLGAVKWTVKIDNDKMAEGPLLGLSSPIESTIRLADTARGVKVSGDLMDQTFYHELVHSMLNALGYSDLDDDEKFVQGMGLLLHQFEKTKK